jgi:hypothetical protein
MTSMVRRDRRDSEVVRERCSDLVCGLHVRSSSWRYMKAESIIDIIEEDNGRLAQLV